MMKTLFTFFLLLALSGAAVEAQTTAFTYQGRLSDGAAQANGTYDLGFALFDAASGGTQIGAAQTRAAVNVSNGVFTVQLDFGAAAFPGATRFLQIAVKRSSDTAFTTLTPRQQVTSTPYAIRAVSAAAADTATNSTQLGGAAANQFVKTSDGRLNDSRPPTAGSANYIQNTTTQQASSNFNVSGSGAANVFNAATQFNIRGDRVLSIAGAVNLFVGIEAGGINTTGSGNSFVGTSAGRFNTTGGSNLFAGADAGFGNTTGNDNSFTGRDAGFYNTTGSSNTFVGKEAGFSNTTGSNNTAIGNGSNVVAGDLTFATAIGATATVSSSNTIALGRSDGTDRVRVYGGVFARGGAPGANGANKNGYAFTGNGGDEDSGLFSIANGQVSLYTNNAERARITDFGLQVFGTLTATTKNFKIDHPLDPLNKTLTYTSVESPDMKNIYDGNQMTDEEGEATVTMPAYFEALNKDFRYQLTVVGQFAQAIVSEEISGNRFKIKTDKPHVKVSWQVTGIRRDRFAEDQRPAVEQEKPAGDRGRCLYAPACVNKPEDK